MPTLHRTARWFVSLLLCVMVGCQRGEELGPVADAASAGKIREAFSSDAGESSGGAVAATGTGWATLKGRFVFDGTPPQMEPYNVNKHQATCASGGKAPLQETLLVDSSTKGIANVAIYIRKASRVHESAQPTDETVEFDQKVCVFLTHVFPITIGQKMDIKNSDPVGHNTNIAGKNGFNQTIPANESVLFVPQKEEAVPVGVACSIHPWMKAYFLPRNDGYYSVTATDGSFEIANVPAGEDLEFQVWHESAGGRGGPLVLSTPEAKKLKWSKKGRFKLRLAENEVKELNLTIPAAAFGG
ncbi:MAG: hypothetical protein MI725_00330 [Pirellulales bacterium]|nr:hypothetical protein [Pirellulales bacterium]